MIRRGRFTNDGVLLEHGFVDLRAGPGEMLMDLPEDFNLEGGGKWKRLPDGSYVAVPPAAVDQGDADRLNKQLKAVLLAAAAMAGKTPAQARAAYRAAVDAL